MAEASSLVKRLQGKVIIITGGASGIGETTARLFANHGPRMIVIADIQDELGQRVASSIGSNVCTYIHCDVSNESQVMSMVHHTVENYGQVDILFSNAGIVNPNQSVLEFDMAAFDRLMAVNARGMVACLKHAAKAMIHGGVKGSIVCTASLGASAGSENYTDYTMSKHAVLGLVKSASVQLGKYGIRVNCVSPSGLVTPLVRNLYGTDTKGVEEIWALFPILKRGEALNVNHVADAVLFLACDESAFITGHDLPIDGGYCRRW